MKENEAVVPPDIKFSLVSYRFKKKAHYSYVIGDRGSIVVKVLRYKSEGHWFDPRWCHGIFH
jgi:hypothetical protein